MSATATMTTTQSTPSIPAGKRRLSARRGSVSASDPWGAHAQLNHNPRRSSSSTLTIVRVQHPSQVPQAPLSLREPPSHGRRNHRRQGSTGSTGGGDAGSPRLSFAFTSFGNKDAPPSTHTPAGRPASPTSMRAASPSRSRHSYAQPRLSPEQLFDLARSSTAPRAGTPGPSPFGDTSPASFTPLAADVYLPFVDRPGEVAALLAHAPSAKLFSLLAQTFPAAPAPPSPTLSTSSSSHSLQAYAHSNHPHSPPRKPELAATDLPDDPLAWAFPDLLAWLTQVPRAAAPDALWVAKARACILGRSELIWERVKGALGVPPELDTDGGDDEVFASSDEEDGGEEGDVFAEWDSAPALDARRGTFSSTHSNPHSHSSFSGEDTEHVSSPNDYDNGYGYGEESDPDVMSLSIENIMSPPPGAAELAATTPPASLRVPPAYGPRHSPLAGDGLSGISEDGENEEEGDAEKEEEEEAAKEELKGTIQGLKISTSPLLSSGPSSPCVYPAQPTHSPSHSLSNLPPLNSSSTWAHIPKLGLSRDALGGLSKSGRSSSFGSVHSLGSASAYDPAAERGPGNPLFPSNFARLAVGPTLRANRPKAQAPLPLPFMKQLAGMGGIERRACVGLSGIEDADTQTATNSRAVNERPRHAIPYTLSMSFFSLVSRIRKATNPPASPVPSAPLRFGVLGAANIAPVALIQPASNHPETIVYAVAARDPKKAEAYAKKHGIGKVYSGPTGYQSLLDDPNVDAVYNPSPNGLHFEWTMKALAAGKHVLLEKPSADTAEETRQMFDFAESKGLVLLEAFHYRFHPAIARVKAILDSGELGPIKDLDARLALPKGIFGAADIRYDYALGGGAMMDMGCYTMNVIRFLSSSNPTEVLTATSRTHASPSATEQLVDVATTATLAFPNGVTGSIFADLAKPWWGFGLLPTMPDISVKVTCERGDVELFNFPGPVFYHSITVNVKGAGGKDKKRTEKAYTFNDGRDEAEWWTTYRYQLDAFVDKVKGRTPKAWITKEDSVDNMVWIEKVYEKNGLGSRPKSKFIPSV
ncbi:hypothetical protein HWV62_27289 [Athelia sp. TMB]|nr:hypothetical protein HWV62_27289 [Athelia sp. TMB]